MNEKYQKLSIKEAENIIGDNTHQFTVMLNLCCDNVGPDNKYSTDLVLFERNGDGGLTARGLLAANMFSVDQSQYGRIDQIIATLGLA